MIYKNTGLAIVIIVLFSCNVRLAKIEAKKMTSREVLKTVDKDSSVKRLASYREVIISRSITTNGLFTIHQIDDHYLLELSDTLLNRDLLVVNRISKGAADGRVGVFGYAGDEFGEHVIQFVKGPRNNVFLKTISYTEVSKDSSANGLYRSVISSNLQPIVASFTIKTIRPDSSALIIDITDYINGENDILFFTNDTKKNLGLSAYQADKSYIERIHVGRENLEINTVRTYAKTGGSFSTYALNSSIVMLPKVPMNPRYYDDRVGYFATGYKDFDANPQKVENTYMVTRWRLEPKPEEVGKYLKRELVEPQKPIVFFIDPATPQKWVPYLVQGVNQWQKAFEKAGFKNAIYAIPTPSGAYLNIESAQQNVIVYKPSEIMNASGPHVHDPRSGEILETHVNWYHNVMQLLRDWYMLQAGVIDPNGRKMEFNDSLMGKLIRYVCTHEIGHTLGLMHNFGASSAVPVDSLRNKSWVEKNGICPSIMDYARFNYVAQPEDSIAESGIIPGIGVYDEWAIEWGYRWFPSFLSKNEEKIFMNNWITSKIQADKRLWYGSDGRDPRIQREDLGDDAVKASFYGIQNLKRIVKQLPIWTKEQNKNKDRTNLAYMYYKLADQYRLYIDHVINTIGGLAIKTVEEKGGGFVEGVSREKQKSAIQFLQQEAFTEPNWLVNEPYVSELSVGPMNNFNQLQEGWIKSILSSYKFLYLREWEGLKPKEAYSVKELLQDMKEGIFSELREKKPITSYRRNLQKVYIKRIIQLTRSEAPRGVGFEETVLAPLNYITDVSSLAKNQLKELYKEINTALERQHFDATSIIHLQDLLDRLKVEACDARTSSLLNASWNLRRACAIQCIRVMPCCAANTS